MLAVGFGRLPTSSWVKCLLVLWVSSFLAVPHGMQAQGLNPRFLWWKQCQPLPTREFPRSLSIPCQHLRSTPWMEGSRDKLSPPRKWSCYCTQYGRALHTYFLTSFSLPPGSGKPGSDSTRKGPRALASEALLWAFHWMIKPCCVLPLGAGLGKAKSEERSWEREQLLRSPGSQLASPLGSVSL